MSFRKYKFLWLLFLIILSHYLVIILYIYGKETKAQLNLDVPVNQYKGAPSETKADNKKRDIYFVKVHKTGSSTLQNILYRFAMKENLRVALFNRPAGMPYPDKPLSKYLYEDITNGQFVPYNIMCDHAVFSKSDVDQYMPSNYLTIALIRSPLSHLRSAFKFWNIARAFKIHPNLKPVEHFLLNNASQYSSHGVYQRLIKNMQAYHLGYASRSNNLAEVESFIQYVRSQFDLVLILERFNESLLLLRRLLHWDMDDIMYIKQFVNAHTDDGLKDSTETTEALRQAHRALALADYRLYEVFNEDLQQRVLAQGVGFQQELEVFQSLEGQLHSICPHICQVLSDVPPPPSQVSPSMEQTASSLDEIRHKLQESQVIYGGGVKWHMEVSLALKDCVAMNLWSQHYHTAFRIHQLPLSCANHSQGSDFPISARLSSEWCDSSSYLFFKFPLQFIHQYIFGELDTGPKSKTLPYCPKSAAHKVFVSSSISNMTFL